MLAIFLSLSIAFGAAAQDKVVRSVLEMGRSDNRTMEHADHLANVIGGRIVGSAALTEALKELYRSGEADEIVLVYQQFRSVLQQNPGTRTLLPLALPEEEGEALPPIYEPDAATVLDRLTELYLETAVRAALLESRTGEHAARMTAMTAAADNTEELIGELTLELNHARQAAITTEISEIVGGAAALRQNEQSRS